MILRIQPTTLGVMQGGRLNLAGYQKPQSSPVLARLLLRTGGYQAKTTQIVYTCTLKEKKFIKHTKRKGTRTVVKTVKHNLLEGWYD